MRVLRSFKLGLYHALHADHAVGGRGGADSRSDALQVAQTCLEIALRDKSEQRAGTALDAPYHDAAFDDFLFFEKRRKKRGRCCAFCRKKNL